MKIDQFDSPIGPIRLQFEPGGLTAVTLLRGESSADPRGHKGTYPHREAFDRYFAGDLDALSKLPVMMNGTEFQRRVWSALRRIPPGRTLSYKELAQNIGNDNATRAVGSANGRNPLCIVVPCHRVISADGSLGGFSAGLDAKRWLLRHEGVAFRA
jgi:methylated-DNA-[protein]-cysteine S-methyltransferase